MTDDSTREVYVRDCHDHCCTHIHSSLETDTVTLKHGSLVGQGLQERYLAILQHLTLYTICAPQMLCTQIYVADSPVSGHDRSQAKDVEDANEAAGLACTTRCCT